MRGSDAAIRRLHGGGFLRGGGFLPDVARRWLLAWCGAAMASCASARRWLLASARCSAAKKVISDDLQVVVRVPMTDIPLPPADARANVGQRRRGVLFLLQPRLQQQLHEQDLTRRRRKKPNCELTEEPLKFL